MEGFEDTARIKEPPRSQEAEQAVIGGVLLDSERFEQIASRVFVQDFYYDNHRLIFKAMQELSDSRRPLDSVRAPF